MQPAYRKLLADRAFLPLLAANTASRLGNGVAGIVITWDVWEGAGAPSLLALAFLAWSAPPVVFSVVAGLVADRYEPRSVMRVAEMLRLTTCIAAGLGSPGGALEPGLLVLVGFLLTSGSAFFNPARAAILPRLVPATHIQAANGLLAAVGQGAALLVGPLVGGMALSALGSAPLFLLAAASSVASLAALNRLPSTTGPRVAGRANPIADAHRALGTIRRIPALLWVVGTFGLGTFLAGGVVELGLVMVMDLLGAGAAGLGMYGTALGLGVILGSALCARRAAHSRVRVVMLAWAAEGALVVALGMSPVLWAALAVGFLSGVATGYLNVSTESLIQEQAGPDTGKVFGYWTLSIWVGEMISVALFAPVLARLTPPPVLGAAGLFLGTLAVLALRWTRGLAAPASSGYRGAGAPVPAPHG